MKEKVLSKSFMWMFIGLLITFVTGLITSNSSVMLENIYGGGYWIFVVAELILVIILSARVMKMKHVTARICFFLYSFVSGLTFSSIFIVYSLNSIMLLFLVAALIFGLMAVVGYTTNIDLTSIGTYFLFGLLGVVIVSLVNIFMQNSMLELVISAICIVLFIGITAYDVQKIKALEESGLPEENVAIYGALELYLDFINIFLHLLQLFGNSDN